MNRAEAKRHVCSVAAQILRDQIDNDHLEFFDYQRDPDRRHWGDRNRILRSLNELIWELDRRGGP